MPIENTPLLGALTQPRSPVNRSEIDRGQQAMKPFPNHHDLERTHGITWHQLVDLEPRLAQLLWESRQAGVSCRCWSDVDRILSPIRNSLSELVGFARKH